MKDGQGLYCNLFMVRGGLDDAKKKKKTGKMYILFGQLKMQKILKTLIIFSLKEHFVTI